MPNGVYVKPKPKQKTAKKPVAAPKATVEKKPVSREHLVLAGLIIGIVVLAAVLFFLLNQPGTGVSFPKKFAQDTHDGISEMQATLTDLVATLQQNGAPPGNEEEYQRLYALAVSNEEEINWLAEKENAIFEELNSTENNLRAAELTAKEAAVFFLITHLATFQEQLVELATTDAEPEETIELAQIEIPGLVPKNFVSPDNVAAFARETGLSESQIRSETKALLAEYLEFKKQRFETETLTVFKMVEAHKLLSWHYILQSLPE